MKHVLEEKQSEFWLGNENMDYWTLVLFDFNKNMEQSGNWNYYIGRMDMSSVRDL